MRNRLTQRVLDWANGIERKPSPVTGAEFVSIDEEFRKHKRGKLINTAMKEVSIIAAQASGVLVGLDLLDEVDTGLNNSGLAALGALGIASYGLYRGFKKDKAANIERISVLENMQTVRTMDQSLDIMANKIR